jgi:hypothetical protein
MQKPHLLAAPFAGTGQRVGLLSFGLCFAALVLEKAKQLALSECAKRLGGQRLPILCRERQRGGFWHLYFVLLHSHTCLDDVHDIVAELLALLNDVHVYRTHGVGIGMVVDVADVLGL